MSGEKRFRSSFLGFKKTDVNEYIEKMLKDFEGELKVKDDELLSLKSQFRDVKSKHDELAQKAEQINEDRTKIADVLIKAQEKADLMLADAKVQALEEKRKLEYILESEKEKLVDIKQEIKGLKSEVVSTLKKYETQLDSLVDGE